MTCPASRHCDKVIPNLWPIMQGGRIEIGTIWPRQRPHFRIQSYGIKNAEVLKRAEHVAFQYRPKVDFLLAVVVESNSQAIWADDLEVCDPVNGMTHGKASLSAMALS